MFATYFFSSYCASRRVVMRASHVENSANMKGENTMSLIHNLCGYRVFFNEENCENIHQLSDENPLVIDIKSGNFSFDQIVMNVDDLAEDFKEEQLQDDSAIYSLFSLVLSLQEQNAIAPAMRSIIAIAHQDEALSHSIALYVSQVSELVALAPNAKTIFHFAAEAELMVEAEDLAGDWL
jgi:hypothetical protein